MEENLGTQFCRSHGSITFAAGRKTLLKWWQAKGFSWGFSHVLVLYYRRKSKICKTCSILNGWPLMTSKSSRNHTANRLPLELQESYCERALTSFFFFFFLQSSSSSGKGVANLWDLTWSEMLPSLEVSKNFVLADLPRHTHTLLQHIHTYWSWSCLNFKHWV